MGWTLFAAGWFPIRRPGDFKLGSLRMNFTLRKSGSTNMLTTFQVVDNAGDIRGTISVPLGAESDLTKHWTEEPATAKRPDPAGDLAGKILVAAKRRGSPRVSKAAILRGCS
jgi:hypothetical protein